MNSPLRFGIFCLLIFTIQFGFSQAEKAELNIEKMKQNAWKKDLSNYQSHQEFFQKEKAILGIANEKDFKFQKEIKTKGDWKHFKYHQFYKGIPVLNGLYILHEKDGVLKKGNGNVLPNIELATTPQFSENEIVKVAKFHALNEAKKENNGTLPADLNFETIEFTNPELFVSDKFYPRSTGQYTLAYQLELEFHSFPPRHDLYTIDAMSGQIIEVMPQVCHLHVDGSVETKYYGKRAVVVDSVAPDKFLLQDLTRGEGIITVNDYTGEVFESTSKDFDLRNEFEDEAAADAHWAASRYYDWLRDSFGFNSIDNEGHELRSVIHLNEGESVVNAFWNGRFATFGDGNCSEYGPLTSIDVVSHEFTHGLTRNNSGLLYRYESGGLNESMSDMFGKGLEYYLNPSGFTWEIAHDFVTDSTANVFRDMSDPYNRNHPKFYRGRNWSFEGMAVHTNSNVMNYWFYLLVEGGSGTNERSTAFDVEKIGMDKAMQIVFTINTAYLLPNSNYLHAYESSVEVAKDIWGVDSPEYSSVLEAWKAVGIAPAADFEMENDLAIYLLNKDTIICGNDATREISVEIENVSNADIMAGTEVELGYQLNSDAGAEASSRKTEKFVLENNLPMGERTILTFSQPLSLNNSTGFRERIEVFLTSSFGDLNLLNNSDFREIFVTEYAKPEAVLSLRRQGSEICQPDVLNFQIEIRNEGCETIPMGTEMRVDVSFPDFDSTIVFQTQFDLPENGRTFEDFEVPILDIPIGEYRYNATLNFTDANANTNQAQGELNLFQEAPADIFEDFSDFDDRDDPYLRLDKSGRNLIKVVEYEGEKMLGFSGSSLGGGNVSSDCNILRKILSENDDFDSRIQFCADMTGINTPTLSFDLTQFSHDNNSGIPKEFATIFFVRTDDPTFEPIIIMEQNNGEVVTHNIPLPDGFKGQITMESFTLFGQLITFFRDNFTAGNINLVDNVTLSNGPVSTSELSDNQLIKVYPNPSSNVVWFENRNGKNGDFSVEIFNSLGAKVGHLLNANEKAEWQSEGQPSGIYFYKISQKNEWIDSGTLILKSL